MASNRNDDPNTPRTLPVELDYALGVPFDYEPQLTKEHRIGAVVHIFNTALADEFAVKLLNLGADAQVMVTTDTPEKADAIRGAFSDWSPEKVEIRLVENRGRDISAKLNQFTDRYADFDLLLFLHSKTTLDEHIGPGWRQELLAGLVGSDDIVRSVLAIFESEPRTGMVFCQHHEPIRRHTGWDGIFPIAEKLAQSWGLQLNEQGVIDFPSGSMFWARPAALQPLLALRLVPADFPGEPLVRTGLGHAVERLFALSAEAAGFVWYKVAAPERYKFRDTILTPSTDADLREFLFDHRRQLLETMVL